MSQEYPSYANLTNLQMLESLYEKWLENPGCVDTSWKNFFEGMQFASQLPKALPPRQDSDDLRVHDLIEAYRIFGHLFAKCDPIRTEDPSFPDELKQENFGFLQKDLDREFPTTGFLQKERGTLKEIIDALQNTYCKTIGIEYMDLGSKEIERWLQKKVEPFFPTHLTNEDRLNILKQLNNAEGFETFLHTKYVGQKRFSLEGAETFIPMLHALLNKGEERGVTHAIIGMAHRGRLNLLANILGKSYAYIFEEFEDYYTPDLSESSGDVKYHKGFIGKYKTQRGKEIEVILSANPSHLESVDPVVEGGVRALQEHVKDKNRQKEIVPILVHGDSAIAGQGVVYETLTLSKLNGYSTKGTIHIVINNQIGFTTLPKDSRSTPYCTDIAKAFGAPVIHVNAEDPEGCVAAAKLAIELRQEFECDVFLDLMGYRKYGHNESDEPTFTQPLQYSLIQNKKTIREIYRDALIEEGLLTKNQAEEIEKKFHAELSGILQKIKSKPSLSQEIKTREGGGHLEALFTSVNTKVGREKLIEIGKKIAHFPNNFNLHPKVKRLLAEREQMLAENPDLPRIDWGMGELLAYATLCDENIHVRLSGQDVRRGTFSHRHAFYVDQLTSSHYFPLSHIREGQAPFDIFNSPLSEFGVLGFEFGYSILYSASLVIWEAQFGDFINGAQIIIDQYLAASEMKWGERTNLTLLLPHGYEGMGPEHSSGRMERFLQLCGNENMIVANCTNSAQFFHILRRQGLREMKKPLVVFTPKILRHPLTKSPLKAFYEGQFEEILDDPNPPQNPKRLLLCSGKIAFDLFGQREKGGEEDVIIRIEQLYPFNERKLKEILKKYTTVKTSVYVQEEHENMGGWPFLRPYLEKILEKGGKLEYVGRGPSASTAAGSHALHKLEHQALIQKLYSEGSSV